MSKSEKENKRKSWNQFFFPSPNSKSNENGYDTNFLTYLINIIQKRAQEYEQNIEMLTKQLESVDNSISSIQTIINSVNQDNYFELENSLQQLKISRKETKVLIKNHFRELHELIGCLSLAQKIQSKFYLTRIQ